MPNVVEIRGLTKRFGKIAAVQELDISVPQGSLFGVIGPNGAGKTTTFSLMAGFLAADSGTIVVQGRTIQRGVPGLGVLSILPQDARLPLGRTVEQIMVDLGVLGGLSAGEAVDRAHDLIFRLGLGTEALRKKIGALSHGQRRRVTIAQAMLGTDEVIVLDEPTAGLDPRTAAELRLLIGELRENRTIILSSHNLAEVEALCDHAVILAKGRAVAEGPMHTLRRSGQEVTIRLEKALPDMPDLVQTALALEGVQECATVSEGTVVRVETDPADTAATSRLLQLLVQRGALVHSVSRGRSLEARFLELTDDAT